MSLFPRQGEGVCADAVIGEHHLRLFCMESGLGPVARLFNVKTKEWIGGGESASDIEDGKTKAGRLAREFFRLNSSGNAQMPALKWKKTG